LSSVALPDPRKWKSGNWVGHRAASQPRNPAPWPADNRHKPLFELSTRYRRPEELFLWADRTFSDVVSKTYRSSSCRKGWEAGLYVLRSGAALAVPTFLHSRRRRDGPIFHSSFLGACCGAGVLAPLIITGTAMNKPASDCGIRLPTGPGVHGSLLGQRFSGGKALAGSSLQRLGRA